MPSYRVHLVGGVVTYLLVLQMIKWTEPTFFTIFQGLIFCLLGALFPDVDVKSKGQKVFYSLLLGLLVYLVIQKKYCMFIVMSFLGMIPILVRHRGIFHHLWFLTIIACVGSWVIKFSCGFYEKIMLSNCWFFFAGAISHVLLDRVGSRLKRYFS